jgi:fatty acid synthase subunit beta
MCVVNPSRSTTFSDAALGEVVNSIATRTASLLEIVNYNVDISLTFKFLTAIRLDFLLCIYRVNNMSAGEVVLKAMTNIFNYLKAKKIDFAK